MDQMKTGVILMSMIEPEDSGDDLTSFLYAIFSDHDLVKVPVLIQKPFAHLMAQRLTEKYRGRYEAIGGRSPQMRQTIEISEKLSERLSASHEGDFVVRVANRYGDPCISDVIREFAGYEEPVDRIVLLPLYPQYSESVTGSAFRQFDHEFLHLRSRFSEDISVRKIASFHDSVPFAESLAENVRASLPAGEDCYLLFTAHAIPESFCDAGDPYISEVEATVEAVMVHLPETAYGLAYHAGTRSSVQWVPPIIDDRLTELASCGVDHLVVIPVGFLTEHTETLYDLDCRCRQAAMKAGIGSFLRVPALQASDSFIEALAGLILNPEN